MFIYDFGFFFFKCDLNEIQSTLFKNNDRLLISFGTCELNLECLHCYKPRSEPQTLLKQNSRV